MNILFKLGHKHKVGKLHHIRSIEYFVSYIDIFITDVSVHVKSDRVKWGLHRSKCLKNLSRGNTINIIITSLTTPGEHRTLKFYKFILIFGNSMVFQIASFNQSTIKKVLS